MEQNERGNNPKKREPRCYTLKEVPDQEGATLQRLQELGQLATEK